jgi:MoxR-like ATPase
LPDAFLRRCIYFHIDFKSLDLKKIILNRLAKYKEDGEIKSLRYNETDLEWLVAHFNSVREICRQKAPATAEMLSWIQLLDKYQFRTPVPGSSLSAADKDVLKLSYCVLAKHIKDLENAVAELEKNSGTGDGGATRSVLK